MYDFIDKVNNIPVLADSIIFTIVIDSLYTNVDIKDFSKKSNKKTRQRCNLTTGT